MTGNVDAIFWSMLMSDLILNFKDVHKDFLPKTSGFWSAKTIIKAVQGFNLKVEKGDAWKILK